MENRPSKPNFISFSKTTSPSPRNSVLQNITNMSSTFQRSVISTSKSKNQNRNGSIDRSKIKALPNYERYSMGNNLPFVTVFQTIEIQRLSDQIETQRIKIKEFQRHMFNAANFQVQIKELSERCTSYEDELNQYREQLDKMNKICQTLYHENQNLKTKQKNSDSSYKTKLQEQSRRNKELNEEIEQWVKKYEINMQARQTELEEMKSMMEKQRKSMIDREIKDQEARHQSQTAKLIIQLRRLNQLLAIKDNQIQDVKKKHQNSQDYIRELKQYGSKLNEYEEKICLLSQEHLRLSRIIDVNASELDMARKKEFKLAQQLKTDKELILDNEHLRELVEMKQKEIETWKQHIKELEQEAAMGRELQHINGQLSAKLTCLSQQNDKLSKLLRERSSEIDRQKTTITTLQQDNTKCREYEDLLIEHECKYKVLQVENERLEGVNKIRVREVQELKSRIVGLQGDAAALARLEKEKKNVEEKYKAQVQRIMELELYIEKSDQQLNIMRQSTNKLQSSQPIIESLKKQNERLHQRIQSHILELTNLKQFESQLGKQYVKMKENERLVSEYEEKLALMNEEIGRLSEMLRNKNQDIVRLEDQRIGNYTLVGQCKGLQASVQEKDRVIGKLKAEVEGFQAKIGGYEQKMDDIDNKNQELFSTLTQQLQTMQQELKKKTKECDQLRTKQAKIQNEILQLSQLQKINQKQQNRITVYLRDLEDLRMQNKEYEAVLTEHKRHSNLLQSELKKIKKNSAVEQQELSTIRSQQSESRKSVQSRSSAMSGSGCGSATVSSGPVDTESLMKRIGELEIILSDLKVKYGDLLKEVSAANGVPVSAGTIKSTSSQSNPITISKTNTNPNQSSNLNTSQTSNSMIQMV